MSAVVAAMLALARDPAVVAAEGRDAPRAMISAGVGGFTDAMGGIGRGGPAVVASLPAYFGARRKVLQWGFALDAEAVLATDAPRAMVGLGPAALLRLHLGRVYALHLAIAPHATFQLGTVRAAGVAPFVITIENAFRFFADDRLRMLVGFRLGPALWFRNDPGNDAPFGPVALAYLGVETPL